MTGKERQLAEFSVGYPPSTPQIFDSLLSYRAMFYPATEPTANLSITKTFHFTWYPPFFIFHSPLTKKNSTLPHAVTWKAVAIAEETGMPVLTALVWQWCYLN